MRHDLDKTRAYAVAEVDEYWIVDPERRTVDVHRRPRGVRYEKAVTYVDGELVPTSVGAPPVDVTELLGPRP